MVMPVLILLTALRRPGIRLPSDTKCPTCAHRFPGVLGRCPDCGAHPTDRGGGPGDR